MARSLLFQSNIPISYWHDCVSTSTYLINRLPSPVLKGQTPFAVLHNKSAKYNHIKVFCCLAYASNSSTQKHKFSNRGIASVFLGYPHGFKGYKLLNLETNEIFIFRDVIFHECIFPFKSEKFKDYHPTKQFCDFFNDRVLPTQAVPDTSTSSNPGNSSKCISKTAIYLKDYHCYNFFESSSTLHHLSKFLSYEKLSYAHLSFVNSVSIREEPETYAQAITDHHWQEAMAAELQALEANGTWSITTLP